MGIVIDNSKLIELLKDKKLFVFDFDGTIANTEPTQCRSYIELLSEHFCDNSLNDSIFNSSYVGKTEFDIWREIGKDFGLNIDDEYILDLMFERRAIFEKMAKQYLKPFDYVYDIVSIFPDTKKIILSSDNYHTISSLLKYWNLLDSFSNIYAYEQLKEKDISKASMLAIIGMLYSSENISSQDIVVFEDVDKYLHIAEHAGYLPIGIRNSYNEETLEFQGYILDMLSE